jgi:glucose-6-phosphate 1-dehydrogenase
MQAVLTNPLRVGLRQERVIPPQCIVIFGASGDLTHRKLVPALFELYRQRRLPSEFAVLGCARRPWSDEDFRSRMAEAMAANIAADPEAWEGFAAALYYEPADLSDPASIVRLGERLDHLDRQRATRGNRTFYLSVSPAFYGSGCRALAAAGLLADSERSRVVIEKPFGTDYASAQALNKVVQACAKENQIFRIDHYLGKETVQNILVLRFANLRADLEPQLHRQRADHRRRNGGGGGAGRLLREQWRPARHGAEPPHPDPGAHGHGAPRPLRRRGDPQ